MKHLKKIMIDRRVRLQEKAIYAYLVVLQGELPDKEGILSDMRLAERSYDRYIESLVQYGYLDGEGKVLE